MGPPGAKGWWTPAVLFASALEAGEHRWWDTAHKDGLAKIGGKRGADFSGVAELGDDMDKVEKDDVTSEVVETEMYKGERTIMQYSNEGNS